jgi:glycosyltransferase involved in cell wall biosynthesis
MIIHISADFPDPLVPGKTSAVTSLLEAAPEFQHRVYSINRVGLRSGLAAQPFGDGHLAIAYGAPPYGVRLAHHLGLVAEMILSDIRHRRLQPDLIHAHKFTVEGLIAERLSAELGVPFIAGLWGDSDKRIFEAKRGLRSVYRGIARKAALLLPAAPWTRDYFAGALQLGREAFELLPVITKADAVMTPTLSAEPRLLSVFALDSWRRKGFHLLVEAVAALAGGPGAPMLDIYGRGGPKALIDMSAIIARAGMQDHVRLMPALPHGSVQAVMNRYAGFVLPSRPETYGMVFVEALLAGVPILWTQNQGIDGFFDRMDVGYCCRRRDVQDVVEGLRYMIANQSRLKQQIGMLQERNAFDHLRRETIARRYRGILASVAGQKDQAADAA